MKIIRSAFGDDELHLTFSDLLKLLITRRLELKWSALVIKLVR